MTTKPAVYKNIANRKCIAFRCENYSHEGVFIGQLCAPCYDAITKGPTEAKFGTAWFYKKPLLIGYLPAYAVHIATHDGAWDSFILNREQTDETDHPVYL